MALASLLYRSVAFWRDRPKCACAQFAPGHCICLRNRFGAVIMPPNWLREMLPGPKRKRTCFMPWKIERNKRKAKKGNILHANIKFVCTGMDISILNVHKNLIGKIRENQILISRFLYCLLFIDRFC